MTWFAFFSALILSIMYVDGVKPLYSKIASLCFEKKQK